MHQSGFRRDDDVCPLFQGGCRTEKIFQHRDLDQEGNPDRLFHIIFPHISCQQFFRSRSQCHRTGKGGTVAQLLSPVAPFHNITVHQTVIKQNSAFVILVKLLRYGQMSFLVGRNAIKADHRIFHGQGVCAALPRRNESPVTPIFADVLIVRRQEQCIDPVLILCGKFVDGCIEDCQVCVRQEFGVSGLLEQTDKTQVKLGSGEKTAAIP